VFEVVVYAADTVQVAAVAVVVEALGLAAYVLPGDVAEGDGYGVEAMRGWLWRVGWFLGRSSKVWPGG
jgi:hypothetical protein